MSVFSDIAKVGVSGIVGAIGYSVVGNVGAAIGMIGTLYLLVRNEDKKSDERPSQFWREQEQRAQEKRREQERIAAGANNYWHNFSLGNPNSTVSKQLKHPKYLHPHGGHR